MGLLLQLALGSGMIGLTFIIQAISFDIIIKKAVVAEAITRKIFKELWQPFMAAMLYLALGCAPLHNLSDALYFATITYTTLGYGDIVLEAQYRMLSGIEAANGFLLFGWTTAFLFEIISQLYRREAKKI
jgi:voltage-gated potassium channel Kch